MGHHLVMDVNGVLVTNIVHPAAGHGIYGDLRDLETPHVSDGKTALVSAVPLFPNQSKAMW